MDIEITILISALSLTFAIIFGISNLRRNEKTDISSDSAKLTTVIVKLDGISEGIKELKKDINDVKGDVKNHSDRIVKLEQQVKVLNKTVFEGGDHDE